MRDWQIYGAACSLLLFFDDKPAAQKGMAQKPGINRFVLQLAGPVLQRDETPARKPLSLDQALKSSDDLHGEAAGRSDAISNAASFFQSFLRLFGFGSKPYSLQRQGVRRVLIEFQSKLWMQRSLAKP